MKAGPRRVTRAPCQEIVETADPSLAGLPALQCWPADGGAFITLPQVYTEDAGRPGWRHSNLGMYRVQLSGNQYEPDREVGGPDVLRGAELEVAGVRDAGLQRIDVRLRGVDFRLADDVLGDEPLAALEVARHRRLLREDRLGPLPRFVVAARARAHSATRSGVRLWGWYWHFVGAVWAALYVTLYLG